MAVALAIAVATAAFEYIYTHLVEAARALALLRQLGPEILVQIERVFLVDGLGESDGRVTGG